MATVRHVRTVPTRRVVEDDTVVERPVATTYWEDSLTRVIWFVAGVILTILTFRFVLAILGANPGNAFANFIYTISHPFVAPFFGLFSYQQQYGISRFEIYTLFAMIVYWAVAWLLTAAVNLGRRY